MFFLRVFVGSGGWLVLTLGVIIWILWGGNRLFSSLRPSRPTTSRAPGADSQQFNLERIIWNALYNLEAVEAAFERGEVSESDVASARARAEHVCAEARALGFVGHIPGER